MSTYNGEGVLLLSERITFDPAKGYVTERRYGGKPANLETYQAARAAAGWSTSIETEGGEATLVITSNDPNGDPEAGSPPDVAYDEWQIRTEFAEVDVWSSEKLRAYIIGAGFASTGTIDNVISAYRSTCTEYLDWLYAADDAKVEGKSGPTPLENFFPKAPPPNASSSGIPYASTELTFLQQLYTQLLMGMTKTRTARVALSRRRQIRDDSTLRYTTGAGTEAWVTSALTTDFDVPAGLAALLPSDPDANNTPTATTWAWAMTEQSAANSGSLYRVIENLSWVFAPVSNFTFTINT